jgi:hypothetical protein
MHMKLFTILSTVFFVLGAFVLPLSGIAIF